MEEILNQIKAIIKWYGDLQKGYNNIEVLMESRRKLTSLSYFLAEVVGEVKFNYDVAYGARKIGIAEAKADIMSSESAAKAETLAIKEKSDLIREEKELEGTYYRLRLLLTQANEVSSTLHQHISNLKIEQNG